MDAQVWEQKSFIPEQIKDQIKEKLEKAALFGTTKRRILELLDSSSIHIPGTTERGLQFTLDDITVFLAQFHLKLSCIISPSGNKYQLQVSLLLHSSEHIWEASEKVSDGDISEQEGAQELLIFFAENRGKIVTEEEVLNRIWKEKTLLSSYIDAARELLKESETLLFIEGRWYIFCEKEQAEQILNSLDKGEKKEEGEAETEDNNSWEASETSEKLTAVDIVASFFEMHQWTPFSLATLVEKTQLNKGTVRNAMNQIQTTLKELSYFGKTLQYIEKLKWYIYASETEIKQILEALEEAEKAQEKEEIRTGNITLRDQRNDLEKAWRGKGGIIQRWYMSTTWVDQGINDLLGKIESVKGSFSLYSQDFLPWFTIDFQNFTIDTISFDNDEFCLLSLLLRRREITFSDIKNLLSIPPVDESILRQYLTFIRASIARKSQQRFTIESTKEGGYKLRTQIRASWNGKGRPSWRNHQDKQPEDQRIQTRILTIVTGLVEKKEKVFLETLLSALGMQEEILLLHIESINKTLWEKRIQKRLEVARWEITLREITAWGQSKRHVWVTAWAWRGRKWGYDERNWISWSHKPEEFIIPEISTEGVIRFWIWKDELALILSENGDISLDEKTWHINNISFTQQEFYLYAYLLSQKWKDVLMQDMVNQFWDGKLQETNLFVLKSSINNKLWNNSRFCIQLNGKSLRIPLLKAQEKQVFQGEWWSLEVYEWQKTIIFIWEKWEKKEISTLSKEAFSYLLSILKAKDYTLKLAWVRSHYIETINLVFSHSSIWITLKRSTKAWTVRIWLVWDDISIVNEKLVEKMEAEIIKSKESFYKDFIQKYKETWGDFDVDISKNRITYLDSQGEEMYEIENLSDKEFLICLVFILNFQTHIPLQNIMVYFHQDDFTRFQVFLWDILQSINKILKDLWVPLEIKKEGKSDYILRQWEGAAEKYETDRWQFILVPEGNKGYSIKYNGIKVGVSKKLYEYISRLLRKYWESWETWFQVSIKWHPEKIINPIKGEIETHKLPFSLGYDGYFSFR